MNFTRIEDAPVVRNVGGVEGRKLGEGPVADLVHIKLEPGAVLEPHAVPVDASFFILEGEAELSCGSEKAVAKPGMLFQSSKGTVHGFRNTGATIFRVLVIKGMM